MFIFVMQIHKKNRLIVPIRASLFYQKFNDMTNIQIIDDFGQGNQTSNEKLIQVFQNTTFGEVRAVDVNGKIYFVGNDIASSLGYKEPHKAITRHCKGGMNHPVSDNQGIVRITKVIPEGDIYRLVIKSELPGAEEFESWIFDEVLPSIREKGIYATEITIDNMIANPDFAIGLLTKLKKDHEEKTRLYADLENKEKTIEIQEGQLKIQAPVVKYANEVLNSDSLIATTLIAKDLGFNSAEKFNKELIKRGILNQQKVNGCYVISSKYSGKGYTHTKTYEYTDSQGGKKTSRLLYWTEKGRLFLNYLFCN